MAALNSFFFFFFLPLSFVFDSGDWIRQYEYEHLHSQSEVVMHHVQSKSG